MHTPPGFSPAHALPDPLDPAARAFAFTDGRLITREEAGAPQLPSVGELRAFAAHGALHYLGELEGHPCVATTVAADVALPPQWKASGLRTLFFRMPDALVALAGRAFQIVDWDATHPFCGRCGTATIARAA